MNRFSFFGLLFALGAPASRASDPPSVPVKLAGMWKLNKALSDDPGRKMMEAMRNGSGASGHGGPGGAGMGGHGGGGMGAPPGGGGGGMGGQGGMGGPPGGGGMGGHGGGRGPGGRGGPGGAGFGGEPPLDGTVENGHPREGSTPSHGGDPGSGGPQGPEGRGPMGLAASPEFVIEQEGDNLAFRTESNLRLLHSDGEKRKKEDASGKLDVVARFLKGSLVIESRPEMGGKRKETYTIQGDGKLQIDFDIEGSGPMPGLKFKLVYDAAPSTQL